MTTKISKSKLGEVRFPRNGTPFDNSVTTMKLTPEQMKHYLQTHELPNKKKRGRPKKMNGEQAQELENTVTAEMLRDITQNNLEIELKKLETELAEVSQNNVKLQNLLDDLQVKYNNLALDYEESQQVRYELTSVEEQRDQLKTSLKETEDELVKETNKRWILETALKLYLP